MDRPWGTGSLCFLPTALVLQLGPARPGRACAFRGICQHALVFCMGLSGGLFG